MSKYFQIDLSEISAGLTHQIGNFMRILLYCNNYNYILIAPIFKLHGIHNNGKHILTNLSDYIDFKTIIVNNKSLEIVFSNENIKNEDIINVEAKTYISGLLVNDDMFKNLECFSIKFSYNENILNISKEISKQLGDYLCIHVRRTDRMTTEEINRDTSPDNILQKIKKYNNKTVYIMTDEKISFFDKLKEQKYYSIYFFSDFEILKKIKEQDNYMLFCIENEICNLANKRISTWKTTNVNKYIDYLSETFGYQ